MFASLFQPPPKGTTCARSRVALDIARPLVSNKAAKAMNYGGMLVIADCHVQQVRQYNKGSHVLQDEHWLMRAFLPKIMFLGGGHLTYGSLVEVEFRLRRSGRLMPRSTEHLHYPFCPDI